jgi:hypothetical protein
VKVISFVLWGEEPLYVHGAARQVEYANRFYPGWQVRIHSDRERPELAATGADVRVLGPAAGVGAMFRRMLPLMDPAVERVIFRDCDSLLSAKEAAAVNAWIKSGLRAHAMHDHQNHRDFPMMGGMWGLAGGFQAILIAIDEWRARPDRFGRWWESLGDQCFLEQMIWPLVRGSCLMHSSVPVPWKYEPFPEHEPLPDGWFVGERRGDSRDA